MHCRFHKEFLTQAYFQATHHTAELPRAVTLVQDSLSDMNMEIQLVLNVFQAVQQNSQYKVLIHFQLLASHSHMEKSMLDALMACVE